MSNPTPLPLSVASPIGRPSPAERTWAAHRRADLLAAVASLPATWTPARSRALAAQVSR